MCARYTTRAEDMDWTEYWEMLRLPPLGEAMRVECEDLDYYAPTDPVPIVRPRADGEHELVRARWALLPKWAKQEHRPLFNVRSESAPTRFRPFYEHQRCILPASGFWEWKKRGGTRKKQKHWFEHADRPLISFAGLWAQAELGGASICTCTILTCEPSPVVAPIHDRMPVILDDDAALAWLDSTTAVEGLGTLLRPYADLVVEAEPLDDGSRGDGSPSGPASGQRSLF